VRRLPWDPFFDGKDPQHIAQLCAETIDDGHSVLMFCGTKKVRRRLGGPPVLLPCMLHLAAAGLASRAAAVLQLRSLVRTDSSRQHFRCSSGVWQDQA
jgi:hypothetical protein